MVWLKIRRLGAINVMKFFTLFQAIYSIFSTVAGFVISAAIFNLLSPFFPGTSTLPDLGVAAFGAQLIEGPVLSIVAGVVFGGLFAAGFNFIASLGFIDGFDLFVSGTPQAGRETTWVKWRLQGAMNTGKILGLALFIIGIPIGLLVAIISVLLSGGLAGSPYARIIGVLGVLGIVIVPILLGVFGFIIGVIQAALGNFVRQLSFVDGIDLQVGKPLAQDGIGWVKLRRLGVVNYAKYSVCISVISGFVAGVVIAVALYARQYGNEAFLAIIAVPVLVAIVSLIFGAIQALIYNFCFSQQFIDGFDLLLYMPKESANTRPTARKTVTGKRTAVR